MKTIYTVLEDQTQVEKALMAFGRSQITSRHLRILSLENTESVHHARSAGISANVSLGLAAAPREEKARRERIRELLEDSGLKFEGNEGLVESIEHGETVLVVNVPEAEAKRAERILSLEEEA